MTTTTHVLLLLMLTWLLLCLVDTTALTIHSYNNSNLRRSKPLEEEKVEVDSNLKSIENNYNIDVQFTLL